MTQSFQKFIQESGELVSTYYLGASRDSWLKLKSVANIHAFDILRVDITAHSKFSEIKNILARENINNIDLSRLVDIIYKNLGLDPTLELLSSTCIPINFEEVDVLLKRVKSCKIAGSKEKFLEEIVNFMEKYPVAEKVIDIFYQECKKMKNLKRDLHKKFPESYLSQLVAEHDSLQKEKISIDVSSGLKVINSADAIYAVPPDYMCNSATRGYLYSRISEKEIIDIIHKRVDSFPGNIIHAGAYFGDMIPSLSAICSSESKIFAFEVDPISYELARETLRLNMIDNCILFNMALWSSPTNLACESQYTPELKLGGKSSAIPISDERYRASQDIKHFVSAVSIDNLSLGNISCIQLDLEGGELMALKGAIKTIKSYKPLVILEDNALPVQNLMTSIGYINSGRCANDYIWEKLNN